MLAELGRRSPGVTILGGLSSARTPDGEAVLFIGDRVVPSGAVGVRFDGVEVLPCVSQGAAPVGPELTVTASEGNVIRELAGRPALARLRDAIEELSSAERGMVANGLLLGVVIDGGKPEYRQGDFLVRGARSAPTPRTARSPSARRSRRGRSCGCTRATPARPTATCAPRSACGSRRSAARRPPARSSSPATAGGAGCSASPTTTPRPSTRSWPARPAAGFFAAGEIGPVGGDPSCMGSRRRSAVFPE